MPENTPRSPQHESRDRGWTPDGTGALPTRKLWAGALALAAVAAGLAAAALHDRGPGPKAAPAAAGTPTDDGSGTPSSASSPSGTAAPPKGRNGIPSPVSRTGAASRVAGTGEPRPDASKAAAQQGTSSNPAALHRSVRSLNRPDRYWQTNGGDLKLGPATSPAARSAATFSLVKGLAKSGCYSFETADGDYLRHRNGLLHAEHDDGSRLFEQDATFCPRPSSFTGATMLESLNRPGRFLRHQDSRLVLDPYQNTDLYRADSAFLLVDGLA
ncbi:alpha-L-arabinofuranosidase [Streptomyces pluripotens]|uniref:Alpha-L-arabinofuranosidase n=1 Tax=Streptomyces pluripotens TaxID=1355015 RepID=A0A221NVG1_9ACTN|nr:AbfB domain-containing protein [Streptomyces sp. MUM 16J]ARP69645.1 hypothetical protein LK06_006430 [Streptomyces pluripotens]ASN23902.1 alpha-L-arabinofuranosidase [Streptomyces pluripotens]MCH0558596.1 AbfB domain-containing protein [Streptomyces sp. MUM 16J]